jgi:hypothetical protein
MLTAFVVRTSKTWASHQKRWAYSRIKRHPRAASVLCIHHYRIIGSLNLVQHSATNVFLHFAGRLLRLLVLLLFYFVVYPLWVCLFIGTDRSWPVPKAFIYWYGWDWTVQLSVWVIIVYSGLDCFKSISLWNYPTVDSQKWYWKLEWLELFVYSGTVWTKFKWSVLINKHTLHASPAKKSWQDLTNILSKNYPRSCKILQNLDNILPKSWQDLVRSCQDLAKIFQQEHNLYEW